MTLAHEQVADEDLDSHIVNGIGSTCRVHNPTAVHICRRNGRDKEPTANARFRDDFNHRRNPGLITEANLPAGLFHVRPPPRPSGPKGLIWPYVGTRSGHWMPEMHCTPLTGKIWQSARFRDRSAWTNARFGCLVETTEARSLGSNHGASFGVGAEQIRAAYGANYQRLTELKIHYDRRICSATTRTSSQRSRATRAVGVVSILR